MAPPPYYDQLSTALSKLGPKPTNAQALALVDAFGGLPLSDADLSNALPTVMGYRWLAHGYRNPGDKFAAATNARFYAQPYPEPAEMAGTLRWVAGQADKYLAAMVAAGDVDPPQPPAVVVIDPATSRGAPAAIAQELAQSWQALTELRKLGVVAGPPVAPKGKARPDVQPPDEPNRDHGQAEGEDDPSMVASWRDLGTTSSVPTLAEVDDGAQTQWKRPPFRGAPPIPERGDVDEAVKPIVDDAKRIIRKGRAKAAQAKSIAVLALLIIIVAAWRRR